MRRLRAALLVLVTAVGVAVPGIRTDAAELQMYRRVGCPWCQAWDRDVGPIYPKTETGRQIPLRMIDLDRDQRPQVLLRSPIIYTPTFVLVENAREVGRIEGYPGDAFFWGLLDRLVRQLNSRS
jgi:hypothetical protein